MAILIALYLLACGLCAYMGRNTRAGALGHFLLAMVVTPIADFLFQWANKLPRQSSSSRQREHGRG